MSGSKGRSDRELPGDAATLLLWLVRMPLASAGELAAVAGWPTVSLYRVLGRLQERGLVGALRTATPGIPSARRWHLTPAGVSMAARALGRPVENLLRTSLASRQGLRLLLGRLDTLATLYRVATLVAETSEVTDFCWCRKLPLDAVLRVQQGSLGIVREGVLARASHLERRLRRVARLPDPPALLLIVPDPLGLADVKRFLRRMPFTAFVAVQAELLRSGPEAPAWHGPFDPEPLPLRLALRHVRGGQAPGERAALRARMPPRDLGGEARPQVHRPGKADEHLLLAGLSAREKRLLDTLALWPLLALEDLAGLLDIAPETARDEMAGMLRAGLVRRLRLDRRVRYALSERGLALLARRDRLSVRRVLDVWSPLSYRAGAPASWRDLRGSRLRGLARHLGHTAAVYRFFASLASQARDMGLELVVALPGHRCRRRFALKGRIFTVKPDGYGCLRCGDGAFHFFLEWERRATGPSRFREKLAPYLRYYASRRPLEDFGTCPALLVVLRDEVEEAHFLRVAEEVMRTGGAVHLQVLASCETLVETQGPLGQVWRVPGGPSRVRLCQARQPRSGAVGLSGVFEA